MKDSYGRIIDYLRISVTDRCSERCFYCMPPEGVPSVSHAMILSYDEILRVVRICAGLGIRKYKITGGEPLVRRGIPGLVREMKKIAGVTCVTITTNGTALAGEMEALAAAGLDAVNISLDTCDPLLYHRITRTGQLEDVLSGIAAARRFPGIPCKIDCVLLGLHEQKLTDVALLAKDDEIHVRFIEMMPIGIGKQMLAHDCSAGALAENETDISASGTHFVSCSEVKSLLTETFGEMSVSGKALGNGPAEYYRLPGFCGQIGFIGAMTHQFCKSCNRIRLTSQGFLKTCLQYSDGVDLRAPLREGAEDSGLEALIQAAVLKKPKEHSFLSETKEREEVRPMSDIGG